MQNTVRVIVFLYPLYNYHENHKTLGIRRFHLTYNCSPQTL